MEIARRKLGAIMKPPLDIPDPVDHVFCHAISCTSLAIVPRPAIDRFFANCRSVMDSGS